jgi:hypothetical protein
VHACVRACACLRACMFVLHIHTTIITFLCITHTHSHTIIFSHTHSHTIIFSLRNGHTAVYYTYKHNITSFITHTHIHIYTRTNYHRGWRKRKAVLAGGRERGERERDVSTPRFRSIQHWHKRTSEGGDMRAHSSLQMTSSSVL